MARVFSEADIRRIVRSVMASERSIINRAQRSGRWQMPAPKLIGKTDEEIDANDGTTPGSGDVSLYMLDTSGDLADTGDTVTAYNLAEKTIDSGEWVLVCEASGVLVIIQGGGTGGPRLLRAGEDISNGEVGADAHPVTLSGVTPTEDTETTVLVNNFLLPMIWNNSYILAQNCGGELIVTVAFSATIIHGQTTTAVAGGSFALENIEGCNGHFDDSTETIQNPHAMSSDDEAWCTAVWNEDGGGSGQWECIQLDCPAP